MLHNPTLAVAPQQARSDQPTTPRQLCNCVAGVVAIAFDLSPDVIIATTRGSPRAALARQIAMYLVHVGFALSFGTVGRAFGRDRTTVAHACRLVEDGRDDINFDHRLAMLELVCRSMAHDSGTGRLASSAWRGGVR